MNWDFFSYNNIQLNIMYIMNVYAVKIVGKYNYFGKLREIFLFLWYYKR